MTVQEISKVTVPGFVPHLHSVGTSAAQIITITPGANVLQKGVLIKAPTTNTLSVFLGKSNVTADQTAGTGGFPLAPGESLTLPIEVATIMYSRAADANQKLNLMLI